MKSFIRIDANGRDGKGLDPVAHDTSDTPVEGAAHPLGYTAYTDPQGVFTAGVWACDAGTLRIQNLAIDEACYLIDGEVHLTDDNGNQQKFGPGEAFLLPKGFTGTWHMPFSIRKYNAMFRR